MWRGPHREPRVELSSVREDICLEHFFAEFPMTPLYNASWLSLQWSKGERGLFENSCLSPSLYLSSSSFDNKLFMFNFTVFDPLTWLDFAFYFFCKELSGESPRKQHAGILNWGLLKQAFTVPGPLTLSKLKVARKLLGWSPLFFFISTVFPLFLSHLKSSHAFLKNV